MTCTNCTAGTEKATTTHSVFKHIPLMDAPVPETQYDLLSSIEKPLKTHEVMGEKVHMLRPGVLEEIAQRAYEEINFKFRPSHLQNLVDAYNRPDASENDKMVISSLLHNAVIAKDGVLPSCQDTGTALVYGWKGRSIVSLSNDEVEISKGVHTAYTTNHLRYSQTAPLDMYREVNTKCNLPAQIEIYSDSNEETKGHFDLLFAAKGGGSANKSALFQKTKALLNPDSLLPFIKDTLRSLGTSACPPYYFSICIGGTSGEKCMEVAKLGSTRQLDSLPSSPSVPGEAFRDLTLEKQIMEMSSNLGIGAQFDGSVFLLDARVIRMARHGASCPVAIAVSCSADRHIRFRISEEGVFMEHLETDPERFLRMVRPDFPLGIAADVTQDKEIEKNDDYVENENSKEISVDLTRGMAHAYEQIRGLPIGTQVNLTGPIVIARDIAHARLRTQLRNGEGLPDYIMNHPVYFAGPAKTPAGYVTGSVGPTTSQRMDTYTAEFINHGAHLVTIGKGNRPGIPPNAVYLAALGGVAAVPAHPETCQFSKIETIEFEELGMEAVRLAETKNMKTVLIANGTGEKLY